VHERDQAVRWSLDTELLSRTEMQHYFPDSDIVSERIGPLVKSLISVR
jgi:hypothetical protein